jgi:hypothetical protein
LLFCDDRSVNNSADTTYIKSQLSRQRIRSCCRIVPFKPLGFKACGPCIGRCASRIHDSPAETWTPLEDYEFETHRPSIRRFAD